MTDQRSPDARIARLEACFAKLDERILGLKDQIKDWKEEAERRLGENNQNAAKLMEERAKDRAMLLTTDVYNSRHQELKTQIESNYRETAARMGEHDRDDMHRHEMDGNRLKLLEEFKASLPEAQTRLKALEDFKSDIQGRLIATGAIATLLGAIAGYLFHLLK